MVLPVTGPVTTFPAESFADNYRQKWMQVMPVDRPLPYRMYRYYGVTNVTSWVNGVYTYNPPTKDATFSVNVMPGFSQIEAATLNQALARLRSKAGATAGWAENLAQMDKTRRMVVDRAVQIANFVTALRLGSFGAAARALRTPIPHNVSRRKGVSQNFLEFEYGLKPVVSDLQESMRALVGTEFEDRPIVGRARSPLSSLSKTFTSDSSFVSRVIDDKRGEVHVQARALLRITNPNLFLANQLGLIDLALPWKLFPFSFIVDWFVNVEQCISASTAWYGCQLLHPHLSEFTRGSRDYFFFQNSTFPNGNTSGQETRTLQEQVTFDRTMDIPGPVLQIKPFKGFSLERGAQAIALVLSVLGK
jgi:hypothetical protein